MTINRPHNIPVANSIYQKPTAPSKTDSLKPEQIRHLLSSTEKQTVIALVQKVFSANDTQRQQLLQIEQQRATITPQLRQILDSPSLKLVLLNMSGQNLLTYTHKPIAPGQQIFLGLDSSGQLTASAGHTLQRLIKKNIPTNPMEPGLPVRTSILQALRKVMPYQAPASNLINTIDQFLTKSGLLQAGPIATQILETQTPELKESLAALPNADRQAQQYSKEQTILQALLKSLHHLLKFRHTPYELSNPKELRKIMQASGIFYENREKQISSLFNTKQNPSDSGDFKVQLINNLNTVRSLLSALPQSPLTTHQSGISSEGFLSLLAQLAEIPFQKLPNHPVLIQLLQQLDIQIHATLSRLYYLQLAALSHKLTQQAGPKHTESPLKSEAEASGKTWLVELPVYADEKYSTLECRIHQRSGNQHKKQSDDREDKRQQWDVMLSFDLPDNGDFFAQLTVIEDTVSVLFWTEHMTMMKKVESNLESFRQQLLNSGMQVEYLQCFKGKPPEPDTQLNYSLVDINA